MYGAPAGTGVETLELPARWCPTRRTNPRTRAPSTRGRGNCARSFRGSAVPGGVATLNGPRSRRMDTRVRRRANASAARASSTDRVAGSPARGSRSGDGRARSSAGGRPSSTGARPRAGALRFTQGASRFMQGTHLFTQGRAAAPVRGAAPSSGDRLTGVQDARRRRGSGMQRPRCCLTDGGKRDARGRRAFLLGGTGSAPGRSAAPVEEAVQR